MYKLYDERDVWNTYRLIVETKKILEDRSDKMCKLTRMSYESMLADYYYQLEVYEQYCRTENVYKD